MESHNTNENSPGFLSNVQGRPTKSTDWTDEDIIIAVVGNAGSGKTTFINIAAAVDLPIGHGMTPCTSSITATRMVIPGLSSQAIVLLDTPGLDIIKTSKSNVIKVVFDWLRKAYRRKVVLSGILFIQQITDTNKLSFGGIQRSLEILTTKPTFPRMRLVTTMWGEIDRSIAASNEQIIFSQWSKVVVNPDLVPCQFDRTQLCCIRIILPFIRSANQRAALRLVEEASKSMATNSTFSQVYFENFARLLDQRRAVIARLLDELEKPTPDRSVLEALVLEHDEISRALQTQFDLGKSPKSPFSELLKGAVDWFISWSWLSSLLGPATQPENDTELRSQIQEDANKISPNDQVVLLLGVTGSGKSQFISDCIGFDAGVNSDLKPCSASVNLVEGTMDGSSIFFIDAPGFDQPEVMSDADILKHIRLWLAALHQRRVRLKGIIFLHNISTKLPPTTYLLTKGLLSQALEERTHVVMVSTHWDLESDARNAAKLHQGFVDTQWSSVIGLGAKNMRVGRGSPSPGVVQNYDSALTVLQTVIGLNGHTEQ